MRDMLHLNCRRGGWLTSENGTKTGGTDKQTLICGSGKRRNNARGARAGGSDLIVSIPCYLTATFCPPTICPHLGQMPNSVFRAAKHEVFVEEKNASGKFSLGNYEAVSLNNSAH